MFLWTLNQWHLHLWFLFICSTLVFIKKIRNFWSIRRTRIYSVDELPHKKKKTYRLNYPTSTTKVWWFWPTSSICVCIAFLKTSMNLMVSIPPKMWRLRVKYNNPILATCRGVVSWAGLWFSWRNLSRSSLIIDHVQSLRLLINVESPF